jgi:ribonuclease P protein component
LARVRRTDRHEARLAVTAPRTVGHAVERNRARRRVREAFRRAIDGLTVMTGLDGLDLLVTARGGAATEEFGALVAEASAVLREATA